MKVNIEPRIVYDLFDESGEFVCTMEAAWRWRGFTALRNATLGTIVVDCAAIATASSGFAGRPSLAEVMQSNKSFNDAFLEAEPKCDTPD